MSKNVKKQQKCNDLVVTSNDNDANASIAAVLDCINHLETRGIQHTDHTDKCTVRLKQYASITLKLL